MFRWPRPAAGYAACALTGDNNPVFPPTYRRWIPVVQGKDKLGRDRGAVLSLVRNHGGAFRGSSWAFSGLTDGTDIFLEEPARRRLLVDVAGRLVDGVFLYGLTTNYAYYKPGEPVQVHANVACYGRRGFVGEVLPVNAARSRWSCRVERPEL